MTWIGDFAAEQTFDHKFCTVTTTGAPTQLAGSPPVISAYLDNSTTQVTAGITLSVDFDSVTGLNNVRVVATTANGYTAGSNFQLVITTGTVGGTSVVGYVIGSFSINARSGLRPTTAGRTLDVSSTGEAGLDWANIGAPTTTQALTGTSVLHVVGTGTGQINSSGGGVPTRGNVKKAAAYAGFTFMMTDSTNHNPLAGISSITLTRSLDGGAFAGGTLSAASAVGAGIYSVDFASGDTTANTIILRAVATGADDTFVRIITSVA